MNAMTDYKLYSPSIRAKGNTIDKKHLHDHFVLPKPFKLQIEIDAQVLKLLIAEHQIYVYQLRCLNFNSKKALQKILLSSIF